MFTSLYKKHWALFFSFLLLLFHLSVTEHINKFHINKPKKPSNISFTQQTFKKCFKLLNDCTKLLQLCLTLCNPMDYSMLGFSVHGILQARTLE